MRSGALTRRSHPTVICRLSVAEAAEAWLSCGFGQVTTRPNISILRTPARRSCGAKPARCCDEDEEERRPVRCGIRFHTFAFACTTFQKKKGGGSIPSRLNLGDRRAPLRNESRFQKRYIGRSKETGGYSVPQRDVSETVARPRANLVKFSVSHDAAIARRAIRLPNVNFCQQSHAPVNMVGA